MIYIKSNGFSELTKLRIKHSHKNIINVSNKLSQESDDYIELEQSIKEEVKQIQKITEENKQGSDQKLKNELTEQDENSLKFYES